LFNDFEIEKTETLEIEPIYIKEEPDGFRFRGAFINDEDLLTGWKEGGGPRHMDYPFYKKTIAQGVMDMVVETVLRLKMNLVIPSSFLDIDNPPEKMLADCVAKRGIYLSQHHLEPLGLSHFTLENYCKRYNKIGEYSYLKYPELLEEAWNYYAKKWAEYDNVVWQVGLRGKADRPVWEEEIPSEKELCDYGRFISNAISKQCEIAQKQTDGRATFFTSTLWMEGSTLMEKGCLDINKNVCIVFSDNGPNQMYGNEYHRVGRYSNLKYGIYYHIQYYDIGPHLAPQTGLDKLWYNIKKAYNNNDREYAIINISNVREFTFEIGAVAKMLWNTNSFDKNDYMTEYCNKVYATKYSEAKELVEKYYNVMPSLDTKYLCNVYEKYFNYFYEEESPGIKNFVLKEGLILKKGMELIAEFERSSPADFEEKIYLELKSVLSEYLALSEKFTKLGEGSSRAARLHTEVKWTLHCITLSSIYRWYIHLYEARIQRSRGDRQESTESLQKACEALEKYIEVRKCAEYGEFKNWYREEIKFNIEKHLEYTKKLL
jgi:hypothetical protein